MHYNKLKLSGDKTEFLHFHPTTRNNSTASMLTITIGDDTVSPNEKAKNLGVMWDRDLSLSQHITAIVKAANFQLY